MTKAAYYQAHKEEHRKSARAWAKRRYAKLRAIVIQAKSRPCADCANTYPAWVMDFDHVKGGKLFNISATLMSHSVESLTDEIDKCEVVCANCHRTRTHNSKEVTK
jgi:hypothetical protein